MDKAVLMWVQDFLNHPILIHLFYAITRLGDWGILWLGYAGYFYFIKKEPKKAKLTVITLLVTSILTDLFFKNIFMRPRPFDTHATIVPRMIRPSSYSFPSGHSATSLASATMIASLDQKLKKPALILAGWIALSRVILCVHYPSDVLCGAILGIGIAKGINWITRKEIRDENNIV